MKTVNLNEAVVWIRELLYMNKTELIRAANLKYPPQDVKKLKKSDVLLFAFERRFNPKARDPTDMSSGQQRTQIYFRKNH